MRRGERIRMILSAALAVGLFAFFLSRANLADVADRIAHLKVAFLLLATAASVGSIFLRAWRWQWILEPVERVAFRPAFAATAIGFAASTLLPLRAGEIVRPAALSRATRVPFSASLASVLFERLLDLATVLFYFVLFVLWPGAKPHLSGKAASNFHLLSLSAVAAAAALLLFACVGLWAVYRRSSAEALLARLARRVPERFRERCLSAGSSFVDGLAVIGHPRAFAWTSIGSLILWFVIYAQIFFLFRAFALSLPFTATIPVLLVTLVGIAVPTPGAVGGFHKACQIALTYFYGVNIDTATGLALIYHLVAFAPVTAIGLFLATRLAEAPPED
jgi:uncharacterized protein (TIRG00374 family)